MIRSLIVLLVAVPGTIWYTIRIVWAVYRNAPNARCVCEEVPRKWAALLLRAAGVKVVLENESVLDDEAPQVLVVNHVSWFDVLALAAWTPGPYVFVSKKEVERIPFFGRAVKACGHIFIDRRDRQRALASLGAARDRLEQECPTIIMFPEGTRSATGELQSFKKGAFVLAIQAGVDIVPTAISGSREIMRKGSMLIRPGTVRIRFGEPISVAGYGLDARDDLSRQARLALAALQSSDTI